MISSGIVPVGRPRHNEGHDEPHAPRRHRHQLRLDGRVAQPMDEGGEKVDQRTEHNDVKKLDTPGQSSGPSLQSRPTKKGKGERSLIYKCQIVGHHS